MFLLFLIAYFSGLVLMVCGLSFKILTPFLLGLAVMPLLYLAKNFTKKCIQFSYNKKEQIISSKKDEILKSFL